MAQLPTQSQFGDYGDWPGRDVLDSGGERCGAVREIYLDRDTGRPEWVLVDVDGDEPRFVPLADAAVESSSIRVAHSSSAVRGAPGIGTAARIDQSDERRLYDHYGVGYSTDMSPSGLPAEADEPTIVAPAPPEPPAPEEIEQADVPEPPAATDPEPEALVPETELISPSASGPGPDVFTPPDGAEPEPVPAQDTGAGKLDAVKSPKVGIAAAVALAAALFVLIRKLR